MSIKYFVPSLVWVVLIFAMLSIPPDHVSRFDFLKIPHLDKLVHTGLFFVFAILNSFAVAKQTRRKWSQLGEHLAVFAAGILAGSTSELMQYYFIPFRIASVSDMIFNIFGTIFGIFAWVLYLKIKAKIIFR